MSLVKERISSAQFVTLVFLSFIGDMALVYPAVMSAGAHQDAWIAGLISIPIGLLTVWIMTAVSNIDPGKTIIELLLELMGKWIGGAVALYFLFFLLMACATYIREIEDFMCTQIYEGTPGGVIRFMAIILLAYGVRLGLETLGIAAQLLLPFFIVFLIALMALLLPDIELEKIRPILNTPVKDMLHTIMFGVYYPFGELCVFAMVYPFVKKEGNMKPKILMVTFIGAVVLNLITFLSLTVLGPYFSEHQFYAAYILAQRINIGNFLQRIEVLMASTWVMSTYFKTAIFYYAFVVGVAQILRLSTYRHLVFPCAFLLFGLSHFVSPNILFYVKEIPDYWLDWVFTYAVVIPILLLILKRLRKKGARTTS